MQDLKNSVEAENKVSYLGEVTRLKNPQGALIVTGWFQTILFKQLKNNDSTMDDLRILR